MIDAHHGWNISFKPLLIGFFLSLLLTLASYYLTVDAPVQGGKLMVLLLGLAGVQALVQFIFFFHLGIESKPRWNLIIFLFMVLVIFVLIGGSLWIMYNLNYNVMSM